jgi:proline dehydrogenase
VIPVASGLRELPARALRSGFMWASRRGSLRRVATSLPPSRALVDRFVAGETLEEALAALERLHDQGFGTTVDVLGEAVAVAHAAEEAASRYVATLEALSQRGLDLNVSVKLSQMGLGLDAALCRQNLERILERATALGAFVRVDMEDHTTTGPTLDLVRALRAEHPDTGVVIQAYLRRSAADVERLIEEGTRVRLCKGAYLEPAAVAFAAKADVDASYVALMERLLEAGTYPALATHDPRIIARARAFARSHDIGPQRFEFQMLYGVRRDLQAQLLAEGYTVRVYVPYGAEWYPYFMRRLAERPANVLFITRSVLREGRGRS